MPSDIHSTIGLTEKQLAWLMKHDPEAYAAALKLLDYEHYRDERERCENSLVEFLIAAWPHIGESGEPNINWHHEAIAEQLEDLVSGKLETAFGPSRSLIVNQPPRTTKTSLISICLNAWVWAQPKHRWGPLMGPHVKFLCVSYGATLAEEIAVKTRRLVLSEWYQRLWGHQVKIREDQGSRANFANTAGGERLSNSIEGGILGRGGDIQIIDDPHHLKGAESDQQRRETLEGMRSLVTRVTDPRRAARVLVMQRLHQDDSTHYAIENWDNPKLIMFPMRFDLVRGRMVPEDDRNYDPDTGQLTEDRDGELLWPEVWTPRAVAQEERELGEYGCTPGESPVLMADLSLRPISEVRVGDEVIGFAVPPGPRDEMHYTWRRRRLRHATVEQVYSLRAPVVKVTLDSGEVIRCTRDHKWYRRAREGRAEYLPIERGSRMCRICPPRLPELTAEEARMGGWLGGFFDGEGSMSRHGVKDEQATGSISFYQGAGRNLPLCSILEQYLSYFGFEYVCYASHRIRNGVEDEHEFRCYRLKGNRLPMFQRFMHIVKPNKWRDRILKAPLDTKWIMGHERVVSIENDGEDTVYALKTSTGNYVVWGLASSNSAGQLAQEPVPRGGGIIKRAWWRLWPDDAEQEAGFLARYRCLLCGWETQVSPMGPTIECTNCGREAERHITYPDTSFRILSVDTAYSEEDQAKNSWNAATRWGIWHDKEEAPRTMLMEMWRGRPPLRTGKMNAGQRGLVEQIDFMATQGQVDVVLIEKKTRGVDLYHELEELLSDRAYRLEFFEPTGRGDKVARLTSVSGFFTSDLVWAPDKKWAETVIEEVEAQPRAQFADLTDTCSAALIFMREAGLLRLKYEHDKDKRRSLMFRSFARSSVAQQYEEA